MFKNIGLNKHFLFLETYIDTDLARNSEYTEELAKENENKAKSHIACKLGEAIYRNFTVTKSVFENENRLTYGMDVIVTTKSELHKFLIEFKQKVLDGVA
jgi:hypothetical protein